MLIHITNLRLRTVIGTNGWERQTTQDVVLNIELEFDGSKAAESDDLADTVNYKDLTDRVVEMVEGSRFYLMEKLAAETAKLLMSEPRVQRAKVRADKPRALSRSDSVSVTETVRRTR